MAILTFRSLFLSFFVFCCCEAQNLGEAHLSVAVVGIRMWQYKGPGGDLNGSFPAEDPSVVFFL